MYCLEKILIREEVTTEKPPGFLHLYMGLSKKRQRKECAMKR